jgi:hypothetical protein
LELLVVPDCPNEALAREVIVRAVAVAGVDVPEVITSVVHTEADAARVGFIGSPTFLVNGLDPFAKPGATTGLSCRMYTTRAGLAGVPDIEELAAALVRADGER